MATKEEINQLSVHEIAASHGRKFVRGACICLSVVWGLSHGLLVSLLGRGIHMSLYMGILESVWLVSLILFLLLLRLSDRIIFESFFLKKAANKKLLSLEMRIFDLKNIAQIETELLTGEYNAKTKACDNLGKEVATAWHTIHIETQKQKEISIPEHILALVSYNKFPNVYKICLTLQEESHMESRLSMFLREITFILTTNYWDEVDVINKKRDQEVGLLNDELDLLKQIYFTQEKA